MRCDTRRDLSIREPYAIGKSVKSLHVANKRDGFDRLALSFSYLSVLPLANT